jgi:hypothetical protein
MLQVQLDVHGTASLSQKIEALRVFLEDKLGMELFLQLYRCIECLPQDEGSDSEQAESALVGLDKDKVKYITLVQQLIASEEVLHAGAY